MIDREEVLKGLEHHRHLEVSRNELSHDECFDCPYRPDEEDTCASLDRMIDDALELLKEQEPKLVLYREDGEYCPQCSTINTRAMGVQRLHRGTRYCPYCGQAVKWE